MIPKGFPIFSVPRSFHKSFRFLYMPYRSSCNTYLRIVFQFFHSEFCQLHSSLTPWVHGKPDLSKSAPVFPCFETVLSSVHSVLSLTLPSKPYDYEVECINEQVLQNQDYHHRQFALMLLNPRKRVPANQNIYYRRVSDLQGKYSV